MKGPQFETAERVRSAARRPGKEPVRFLLGQRIGCCRPAVPVGGKRIRIFWEEEVSEPAIPQGQARPPPAGEIPPEDPIDGPAGEGWMRGRMRVLYRPEKARLREWGLFVVHPCPLLVCRFQDFRVRQAWAWRRVLPAPPDRGDVKA